MPGISWKIAFGLAAPLLSAVALANAPLQDSGDIVVTCERPHIEAGLWRFTLWPSHGASEIVGERRMQVASRGHDAEVCIPDADFAVMVKRLLGNPPQRDLVDNCSTLHVRIAAGRLSASQTCSRVVPARPSVPIRPRAIRER